MIASPHFSSPFSAGKAATRTTGVSSPSNSYSLRSSRTSSSTSSRISSSSTMSHLFSATTIAGTPTWRGEQHVLAGLRHRAVGGGDHEDRTVHLGGTGDHVLDVVGVTRAVHVRVVPV